MKESKRNQGINTGWTQERHGSGIERSQEVCNVLLQISKESIYPLILNLTQHKDRTSELNLIL